MVFLSALSAHWNSRAGSSGARTTFNVGLTMSSGPASHSAPRRGLGRTVVLSDGVNAVASTTW